MFFAPVAYGRFFNLLAAIIASISNSVVLIVPSPVFSRCHQLQVFDSVVIFDVVAMVNHITFGHVAEVKPPNRLVERNCAEEMPFFGLVENLPVEFNMRLIEDFDFRSRFSRSFSAKSRCSGSVINNRLRKLTLHAETFRIN